MEGSSGGGSGGGGGGPESFEMLAKKGLQQMLPVLLVMMAAATLMGAGRQDAQVGGRPAGRPEAAVWGGESVHGRNAWHSAPSPLAHHPPALCVLTTPRQEVSFQWFKTQLLAKGAVEKLEVANKQMVKVRA